MRDLALSNGNDFHLIAWVVRGKSFIYGVNCEKSSKKFKRFFRDKRVSVYCSHAEMSAIEKSRATKKDILYIARFRKDGTLCMSRPCVHCFKHIRRAGIKKIIYSDWNGNFVKENVRY